MWCSTLQGKPMIFDSYARVTVMIGMLTGFAVAQSPVLSKTNLCDLQLSLSEGQQRPVRVEGIYLAGMEGEYLVDPNCSRRSTAVEFQLSSRHLQKRLNHLVDKTNSRKHVRGDGDPVLVVFTGQFYGPQVPDPHLPEQIRKNYHPGWDPMDNATTKLVVRSIESVKALATGHPCARREDNLWPCWQTDKTDASR
jgi:hypothetical protein